MMELRTMKKSLLVGCILWVGSWVFAEEVKMISVTGDRVSLRAKPSLTAVLLGHTVLGEELELFDDSESEWVAVRPPERLDFWVHSDWIEEDTVMPGRLNVRSGPSLSHDVVGIISRGDIVTVRGELDGWLRIAPLDGTQVWISRRYVNLPEKGQVIIHIEPAEPTEAAVEAAEEAEAVRIIHTVLQPVVNELMIAAADVMEIPETLEPAEDKDQGQAGMFTGVLMPLTKKLYQLVEPRANNMVLCYVWGQPKQMASIAERPMMITGKVYWAKGLKLPLLRPEKITVIK